MTDRDDELTDTTVTSVVVTVISQCLHLEVMSFTLHKVLLPSLDEVWAGSRLIYLRPDFEKSRLRSLTAVT